MKQILGIIPQREIDKWFLNEYKDKNIVFYSDREEHCREHISQYESEKDYYYTMANLKEIIRNPSYVYYDVNKRGLEFYKRFRNNILVAVRVSSGNELRVKSVYPVSDTKIANRKKKEREAIENALKDKYTHKEITYSNERI